MYVLPDLPYGYDSLSPFVSAEIVLRLHFAGFPLDEVGIVGRPRLSGRASIMKPKNILHTIREMLALKKELVG